LEYIHLFICFFENSETSKSCSLVFSSLKYQEYIKGDYQVKTYKNYYFVLLILLLFSNITTQVLEDYYFDYCNTKHGLLNYVYADPDPNDRPDITFSNTYEPSGNDAKIKVHYNLTGSHYTTTAYAEFVGDSLQYYYDILDTTYGFYNLPYDCGFGTLNCTNYGGNYKLDVYIIDPDTLYTDDFWGMVSAENEIPADTTGSGVTSFMEISRLIPFNDNDDLNNNTLKSVLIHELFHAMQNIYSITECLDENVSKCQDLWFNENVSVYIEDFLFPANSLIDSLQVNISQNPIKRMEFGINYMISNSTKYEYAGSLWPRFLIEKYDDPDSLILIKRILEEWESTGTIANSIDSVLTDVSYNYDSTFDDALIEYAHWRIMLLDPNDTGHFSNPSRYPSTGMDTYASNYPFYNRENFTNSCQKMGAVELSRFVNISSNFSMTFIDEVPFDLKAKYYKFDGNSYIDTTNITFDSFYDQEEELYSNYFSNSFSLGNCDTLYLSVMRFFRPPI